MDLTELMHVGIVVPDLEAGMAHFTELLGIGWATPMENQIEIVDADGTVTPVLNRICYSAEPPYLELIEEAPGTPWVCNEYSNLHHIGFYGSSPAAASEHFAGVGCPLEIRSGGDGDPAWIYHRDPLGVRVEVIDAAIRPMMAQFMWGDPTR